MIGDFLQKKIGISVAICLIIIKPSHNYLLGVTIGCEKFKTWTGSIKAEKRFPSRYGQFASFVHLTSFSV